MSSRPAAPPQNPGDYPPFGENPNAACKQHPTEWWFPARGEGHTTSETTHAAIRICHTCPLLHECREWALARTWTDGIWGGLTLHERAYERRSRRQQARIRKA